MQLCAHIGRRLAARPVLFVLTRRDKPDRPDADALLADLAGRGVEVAEIELGPLAAAELAAVARSVADLTDDAVEQVIRAADGNPLLAVESARALAAGRAAPPPNLRAAVRAATGALAAPGAGPGRGARRRRPRAVRGRARRAVPQPGAGRPRRRRGGRPRHRAGHPGGRRAALPARAARRGGPGRPGGAGPPLRAAGAGHRGGRSGTGRRWPPRSPATCTGRAATTSPDRAGSGRPGTPGRWARCRRRPVLGRGGALRPGRRGRCGWSWPRPSAGSARTPTSSASGRRPSSSCPEERQSVAWCRRGLVLRTVVCNPGRRSPPTSGPPELLPPDAPPRLRVDVLLGTAWCESAGR